MSVRGQVEIKLKVKSEIKCELLFHFNFDFAQKRIRMLPCITPECKSHFLSTFLTDLYLCLQNTSQPRSNEHLIISSNLTETTSLDPISESHLLFIMIEYAQWQYLESLLNTTWVVYRYPFLQMKSH